MAKDFIIRNASPYWGLEYLPKDKIGQPRTPVELPGYNVLNTVLGKTSVPNNILRKLEFINVVEQLKKEVTCKIGFSHLTSGEANHPMFKQGAGYVVYLGWWDWWSTGKFTKRIFDGVVKLHRCIYESGGIKISLTLTNLPGVSLRSACNPAGRDLDLYNSKGLQDAFQRVADYLEVSLAFNWWGADHTLTADEKKWYNKAIFIEQPWRVRITKIVEVKGKKIVIPVTQADILDEICERYGRVWNIFDNILYVGTERIRENNDSVVPEKVFDYRHGHADIFPPQQVGHINSEVYEKIDVIDPAVQKSGTHSHAAIDGRKKDAKIKNIKGKKSKADRSLVEVYGSVIDIEASVDSVREELRKAANTQEALQLVATPDIAQLTANYRAKTTEDAEVQASGKVKKGEDNALAIRIVGATGDPTFRPGDFLMLKGVMERHEGFYVAKKVDHILKAGGYYKMDITATAEKDPLRLGNDLTKPASVRKLDQKAWAEKIKKKMEEKRKIAIYSSYQSTVTRERAKIAKEGGV
jgi:hypothetical protein